MKVTSLLTTLFFIAVGVKAAATLPEAGCRDDCDSRQNRCLGDAARDRNHRDEAQERRCNEEHNGCVQSCRDRDRDHDRGHDRDHDKDRDHNHH